MLLLRSKRLTDIDKYKGRFDEAISTGSVTDAYCADKFIMNEKNLNLISKCMEILLYSNIYKCYQTIR